MTICGSSYHVAKEIIIVDIIRRMLRQVGGNGLSFTIVTIIDLKLPLLHKRVSTKLDIDSYYRGHTTECRVRLQ